MPSSDFIFPIVSHGKDTALVAALPGLVRKILQQHQNQRHFGANLTGIILSCDRNITKLTATALCAAPIARTKLPRHTWHYPKLFFLSKNKTFANDP